MSDDEYYLDSPYDEFEEMLWDADPAPNLADDLAQHAAYSPVWQDDPVGELEPYHSDWEYYSDDYYDDDPAILRNAPMDGSQPRKRGANTIHVKRGRKRKLEEAEGSLDLAETNSLRSTIQGTIWAENTSPRTKTFKTGQQETVALLVDWRKRFQSGHNKNQRPARATLVRDESWANDMSLADMGLSHVRGWRETQPNANAAEDDNEEEEDVEDLESNVRENEEFQETEQMVSGMVITVIEDGQTLEGSSSRTSGQQTMRADKEEPPGDESSDISTSMISTPHKKRKPSNSKRLRKTTKSSANQTPEKADKSTSRGKVEDEPMIVVEPKIKGENFGKRKRNESVSVDETLEVTQSVSNSRTKRVKSTRLRQSESDIPTDEPPATRTRTARARQR